MTPSIPYLILNFVAIALNAFIAIQINRKSKSSFKSLILCLVFETIGFVIGAKLLDVAERPDSYAKLISDGEIIQVLISGFAFTGGFIGAILGILLFASVKKVDPQSFCALLIPNLLLVYAIGKLGCLTVGCCAGSIFGGIVPLQAVEGITYFLSYLIVMFGAKNSAVRIFLSILLFCLARFIFGFFRYQIGPLGFSLSQVFTFFGFFVALFMLVRQKTSR